jgi:hypothetical protein
MDMIFSSRPEDVLLSPDDIDPLRKIKPPLRDLRHGKEGVLKAQAVRRFVERFQSRQYPGAAGNKK